MAAAAALTFVTQAAADVWRTTAEGQTVLRPFASAPYPHPSRANGFTTASGSYPYAGHYDDSTVGVFIPAGYRPSATVDFVVHFHGHLNNVANVLDRFALRSQFAASGLNAVLVVPQGPRDAADSGCGTLELEPGALKALLEEVAAFLRSEGKTTSTRIGRVALTAHSGGYKVAAAVLAHGGLESQITDVLLFDATYGSLERFAVWLAGRKGRRLVSIFTDHLAGENVQLMALLRERKAGFTVTLDSPRLSDDTVKARGAHFVHTLDLEHNEVVAARGYFARWLASSALSKRTDRD